MDRDRDGGALMAIRPKNWSFSLSVANFWAGILAERRSRLKTERVSGFDNKALYGLNATLQWNAIMCLFIAPAPISLARVS